MDDQDDLDAVAGSLGLFGIVLSITFKLDQMPYATFFGGRVQGETLEEYMARPGQPLSDKMLDMMEV